MVPSLFQSKLEDLRLIFGSLVHPVTQPNCILGPSFGDAEKKHKACHSATPGNNCLQMSQSLGQLEFRLKEQVV